MVDPTPMVGRLDFFEEPTVTSSWGTSTFPRPGQNMRLENTGANTVEISFELGDSPTVHGEIAAGDYVEFLNRLRSFVRFRSTSGSTLRVSAW